MRVLALAALALAFVLPGCTQNDPGAGDGEDYMSCPSWIKYPHNGQIIDASMLFSKDTVQPDLERWDFMEWNDTRPGQGIGDGHLVEYADHPLDQIVFNYHLREKSGGDPARALYTEDAQLTLRFYASEGGYQGRALEAYDEALGKASSKNEWVFRSDPQTRYAFHNVTLRVELAQPDEDPAPSGVFLQWSFAPNLDGNMDTPSFAVIRYAPEFWYRTCSSDGTKV